MGMNPRLLRPIAGGVHPEAGDWANRVRTNGGSVSGSTLNAVSKFCRAIDAAGIRDRFYRLNLFCGNSDASLIAPRVPLFRGPSLGGATYGNTLDTSVNFVQGDYNETGASGGLKGQSGSPGKYLDTGLTYDAMGVPATSHIAVFKSAGTWASNQELIGARDADDLYYLQGRTPSGAQHLMNGFAGAANGVLNAPVSTNTSFLTLSRTSATLLTLYENASSVGTNTVSITPGGCNHTFLVFTRDDGTGPASLQWPHRLMAYSFGLGLSAAQVTACNTAMQAFQTALSRNV